MGAPPSFVSGAEAALPAVRLRSGLLADIAAAVAQRAELTKSVGISDAEMDLDTLQEQVRFAEEDREMERQKDALSEQMARFSMAARAAEAERNLETQRLRAQLTRAGRSRGGGGRRGGGRRGGSAKPLPAERARQVRPEVAFKETVKAKPKGSAMERVRAAGALSRARASGGITKAQAEGHMKQLRAEARQAQRGRNLNTRERAVIIGLGGSNLSRDEAFARIDSAERRGVYDNPRSRVFGADPDALREALDRVYGADGRVKGTFVEWAVKVGEEEFPRWQDITARHERRRLEEEEGAAEEDDDRSLLSRLGGGALDILSLLERPAAAIREVAVGDTEKFLPALLNRDLPDILGGDKPEERVSGVEALVGKRGVKLDIPIPLVTGALEFAAEVVTDPLLLIPAGTLTRAGAAAGRAARLPQAFENVAQTSAGQIVRQGLVRGTATRDFLRNLPKEVRNRAVTSGEIAAGRQAARIAQAETDAAARMRTILGDIDPEAAVIDGRSFNEVAFDAYDVGGDVAATADDLAARGFGTEAEALRNANVMRLETPEILVRAGVDPEDLLAPDDYIRRLNSPEGRRALGLPDAVVQGPTNITRTGTLKGRSFMPEATRAERAAALGVNEGLVVRPFELIADSWKKAKVIEGRALMGDELATFGREIGRPDLVWRPRPGRDLRKAQRGSVGEAARERAIFAARGRGATEDVVRREGDAAAKRAIRETVNTPPDGYIKIAPNAYVPKALADDFVNIARKGTEHKLVRGYDKALNIGRATTLLNPASAPPYMIRNGYTAVAMNILRGVLAGPRKYNQLHRLHRASTAAERTAAGQGPEAIQAALRAQGLDDDSVRLVMNLREDGIFTPGRGFAGRLEETTLDPGGTRILSGPSPFAEVKPILGTRLASRINKAVEEVPRAVLYDDVIRKGGTREDAMKTVWDTHFNYGAAGKSAFERNILSRGAFFYVFAVRNPKAFAWALAYNPRVLAVFNKVPGAGFPTPDNATEFSTPTGYFFETPPVTLAENLFKGPRLIDDITSGNITGSSLSNPLIGAFFGDRGLTSDATAVEKARALLPPVDRIARDVSDLAAGGDRRDRLAIKALGARLGKPPDDPLAPLSAAQRLGQGEALSEDDRELLTFAALEIEARRLNIRGRSDMNTEEMIRAIEAADGEIRPRLPSKTELDAIAQNRNIPSSVTEGLSRGELADLVEQTPDPLPVIPFKEDVNDIAKLYGVKSPGKYNINELLGFLAGTPELTDLLAVINQPGFVAGAQAGSNIKNKEEDLTSINILTQLLSGN